MLPPIDKLDTVEQKIDQLLAETRRWHADPEQRQRIKRSFSMGDVGAVRLPWRRQQASGGLACLQRMVETALLSRHFRLLHAYQFLQRGSRATLPGPMSHISSGVPRQTRVVARDSLDNSLGLSASVVTASAMATLGGAASVTGARGALPRASPSETSSEGSLLPGREGSMDSIQHFESEEEETIDDESYCTEETVFEEESEEVPVTDPGMSESGSSDSSGDTSGSDSDEPLVSAAEILARHAAAAASGRKVSTPTTPITPRRRSWRKDSQGAPIRSGPKTRRVVRTVRKVVLVKRHRPRARRSVPPKQSRESPARIRSTNQVKPVKTVPEQRDTLVRDIATIFKGSKKESVYGTAPSAARRLHFATVQSKLDKNRPLPLEWGPRSSLQTSYRASAVTEPAVAQLREIYDAYNVGSCTESVPPSIANYTMSVYGGTQATVVHEVDGLEGVHGEGSSSGRRTPKQADSPSRVLGVVENAALKQRIEELEDMVAELRKSRPSSPAHGTPYSTQHPVDDDESTTGDAPTAVWMARYAALEAQHDRLLMDVETHETAIATERLEAARAHQRLDTVEAEAFLERTRFSKREESFMRELTHAETKADRHKAEADSLRADLTTIESRFGDACRVRDLQVEDLKGQLQRANEAQSDLEAQVDTLEQQVLRVAEEAGTLRESLARRKQEADEAEQLRDTQSHHHHPPHHPQQAASKSQPRISNPRNVTFSEVPERSISEPYTREARSLTGEGYSVASSPAAVLPEPPSASLDTKSVSPPRPTSPEEGLSQPVQSAAAAAWARPAAPAPLCSLSPPVSESEATTELSPQGHTVQQMLRLAQHPPRLQTSMSVSNPRNDEGGHALLAARSVSAASSKDAGLRGGRLSQDRRPMMSLSNPRNAEDTESAGDFLDREFGWRSGTEDAQHPRLSGGGRVTFGPTRVAPRRMDESEEDDSVDPEEGAPPQSCDSPVGMVTPRAPVSPQHHDITIRKHPNDVLGAKFRDETTLILEDVEEGTPSAMHGLESYLGQMLTHIGNTAVYTCNDVRQFSLGAVRITLRFDSVVHTIKPKHFSD